MTLLHKLEDHLLIPFGGDDPTAGGIDVVGVSTAGLFVESELPLACIRRADQRGLRLRDFATVMPGEWPELPDSADALTFLESRITACCAADQPLQLQFVRAYFDYCRKATAPPPMWAGRPPHERPDPFNESRWIFEALLPLPMANLHEIDPRNPRALPTRSSAVCVSFAFWTGRRLLAVVFQYPPGAGSREPARERVERAGAQVVFVARDRIEADGYAAIGEMPDEVSYFWKFAEMKQRRNPLDYSGDA